VPDFDTSISVHWLFRGHLRAPHMFQRLRVVGKYFLAAGVVSERLERERAPEKEGMNCGEKWNDVFGQLSRDVQVGRRNGCRSAFAFPFLIGGVGDEDLGSWPVEPALAAPTGKEVVPVCDADELLSE